MAIFELQNNLLLVKVKSFGAELCSVISKDKHIEYIWQANEKIWGRHAPSLFPIVGKLKDGKFNYTDQTFQLSQHGFARDSEFVCVEQSDNVLVFELTASEQTLKNYPFHFSLQIRYELQESTLRTSYSVFNPDNSDLYFSVGAHPAFNVPLIANELFTDYELVFPDKDELTINSLNDGLIADSTSTITLKSHSLPLSKQLFDKDALVFMNHQIDEVILRSNVSGRGVTIKSEGWPFFGIWTKRDSDQFVCLEPWYGIADGVEASGEIDAKTGIIKLASEQRFECFYDTLFF